MRATDTGIFIFLTVIILTVSVFGGHIMFNGQPAFSVSGVPGEKDVKASSNTPGVFGIIAWIWDSVKFFFMLLAFSVPGVPAIFSVIWLFIVVCYLWILIRLIRGASISP